MAQSCIAADLLTASKCLCGIPSGKREQVMIYLLQQLAGLGNLTAAQLLDRAKCLCGLSEHDMKAIEVALLCTATGGVPPCPPCPPSGGCDFQDMQVAWTPTNLKLGEYIDFVTFSDIPFTTLVFDQASPRGGFDIENTSSLTSISFPNMTTMGSIINGDGYFVFLANTGLVSLSAPLVTYFNRTPAFAGNTSLASLDISALVDAHSGIDIEDTALTLLSLPVYQGSLTGGGFIQVKNNPLMASLSMPSLVGTGTTGDLVCSGNTSLVTVTLTAFLPNNGQTVDFTGCALSAASVNHILARCVANAGYVSGIVNTSGQTPAAPPTGQGIADKATLIGRGVTVNTD